MSGGCIHSDGHCPSRHSAGCRVPHHQHPVTVASMCCADSPTMSAESGVLRCAELVEQLMRTTGDETLVYPVRTATSARHLASVLGAVLPQLQVGLLAGSPAACLLGLTDIDPNWRDQYPAGPDSLWAELELLRALHCTAVAADPLEELFAARAVAAADLPQ